MKKIFTICFLLLSFAACSQPTEGNSVSFMVFGEPAELQAYQSLIKAFQAQHPEIPIALGHVPSQREYQQRLTADLTAGAPPDVMLLNYRRFVSLAVQGGLEPLDSYLAQSNLIRQDDFFAPTIEAFTLDGRLWCIPQNVSSLVVYYNRGLFDAAGLPYPSDNWTRDEFLSVAHTLTHDLDNDGKIDQYGVGISPNLFRLAPLIWQNGGELVDDSLNPGRLALDSPAALAAFQWLVNLQVRERVVPDVIAETTESSESRFMNGRLAMYFNSRRGVPTYRTITSFEWDVAPLPYGQQPAGVLHSDGYCMASTTKNKEEAWLFIEFANSVQGQSLMATTGRTVPSLRQVAESPSFLDPAQAPANNRAFIDTIEQLRRVPLITTWPGIEETASREIERAFYGQATVEEAAATAISFTLPYFEQAATNH